MFVLIHIFLENCRRTGHRRTGLAWQDKQAGIKMRTRVSGTYTLCTHTALSGDPLDLVVDNTALSRKVLNDAASHFPCRRWTVGEIIWFHLLDFQQLGLTRYVVRRSTGEKVVEASRFETSRRKRHDPDMYANLELKSCCAGRQRAYLCGGSGLSTYI